MHILMSGAIGGTIDEFHIFEQNKFCRGEARFIKPAFDNCLYALIAGSLSTQEVSMTVGSIRTAVQKRDITGDHFFLPPGEMSFGKVDLVGEIDHLAQEIRPCAETLDDAGDLLPASC